MDINPPIVVGVDGSPSSGEAVEWAARAAALRDAPLHLTTALPVPISFGANIPQSFFDAQRSDAERTLREAADVAKKVAGDKELNLHAEYRNGAAIPNLLDLSEHARMIVLGRRGHGELTGELLGSVTSAAVTHAACPVVVISEGCSQAGDGPVLVGVDGSKNSEPAIAAAFAEASFRGTSVRAVHAWGNSAADRLGFADEMPWGEIETAETALVSESLAGYDERYPDVAIERVIVRERPVAALLDRSADAQLVVVGSRGRGGFRGLLLGSTSRSLLQKVERPLMVVRDHR